MPYELELDLFHTCKDENLDCNPTPFKARANGKQWLGEGYYFWVESLFFAEKWGEQSPSYKSCGYAILQYKLTIKRSDLLDLVGSPYDQQEFAEVFDDFKEIHNEASLELTLSACINWLQKSGSWKWQATKLADYGKEKDLKQRAIKISMNNELTFLKPRIQLCIHYLEDIDLNFIRKVKVGKYIIRKFSSYKQVKQ